MRAFSEIHSRLRAIMLDAAPDTIVTVDEPGSLILRTAIVDEKTGEPGWFGTVTTKKSYVAYHLMSLYSNPSLADGLSPALLKRRHGKTCFNFTKMDEALFAELHDVSRRASGG